MTKNIGLSLTGVLALELALTVVSPAWGGPDGKNGLESRKRLEIGSIPWSLAKPLWEGWANIPMLVLSHQLILNRICVVFIHN